MKKQILAVALIGWMIAGSTAAFAQSRGSVNIDAQVEFKHVESIQILDKSFAVEGDARWVESYDLIQDKNTNVVVIH